MTEGNITISAKLFHWKSGINGTHPIKIVIRANGQKTVKSIGMFCAPSFWDEKKGLVKSKHPESITMNGTILKAIKELTDETFDLKKKNRKVTSKRLRSVLEPDTPKYMTVLKFWQKHIDELKKTGQVGTSHVRRESLAAFTKFLRGRDISFHDINLSLLHDYAQWLRAAGLKKSSIHLRMRDVRAIWRKAEVYDIVNMVDYPFGSKDDGKNLKKFWLGQFKNTTIKRAISERAIRAVKAIEADTVKEAGLFNAKNYFMLSYFLGGMPWADLIQLRWSDVDFKESTIIYERQKTGNEVQVTIIPEAENILRYYQMFTGGDALNYVLPVLDVRLHITATQIRDRRKKVLKQVNKSLHEIENRVGLCSGVLTSYVARHTAATQAKRKKATNEEIGNMLGHADAKTTEIYIKSLPKDSKIHSLLSLE